MMSSLYIGASGMVTHSRGMQVVGNNLANQSTVGFKQNLALYQELFYSTVHTPSNNITNISQLGHGSQLGANPTIFTEGALESSNTFSDLAIMDGNGFFGVIKDDKLLFTRAGNLRFDKEGRLLDPKNYNLVGHKIINGELSPAFEPIQLDMSAEGIMTSLPRATSAVSVLSHLGGMGNSQAGAPVPLFAMTSAWDGARLPPLLQEQYAYTDVVSIYDQAGNSQELNIYYNHIGQMNGVDLYEYCAAIDPELDASGRAGTAAAGLLLSGSMSFSSTGEITGMTAYALNGNDPADLSAWTPAPLVGGLPVMAANFSAGDAQNITLNFGLNLSAGQDPALTSPALAAASGGTEAFYRPTPGAQREAGASTTYGSSPVNRYQSQDGYGEGSLRDVYVSEDGFIRARYSNGQSEDLYRISLFRFVSRDGLRREGGNHFSATAESGPYEEGMPDTENFGILLGGHLETSNVDIAREFTWMILNQRGFQMNSKVITTSDAMLQRVLELKR